MGRTLAARNFYTPRMLICDAMSKHYNRTLGAIDLQAAFAECELTTRTAVREINQLVKEGILELMASPTEPLDRKKGPSYHWARWLV